MTRHNKAIIYTFILIVAFIVGVTLLTPPNEQITPLPIELRYIVVGCAIGIIISIYKLIYLLIK